MADPVDVKEVEEVGTYVHRVASRAEELAKSVAELDSHREELAVRAKALRKQCASEVSELKDDVRFLKDNVREIQKLMIMMIGQMKNTLKQSDFDNFEKRMDLWAPESLVTRQEAQRLVKKVKP